MINVALNNLPLIIPLLICVILLLLFFAWNVKLRQKIRRNEKKHIKHENRYKKIHDAADDAIVLYNPETDKIDDFNPALCDIFGYKPEEVYYLNIELLFSADPPYSFDDVQPRIKAALDGSAQVFEWLTTDHSGEKIWVEISIKKIFLSGKMFLLIFIRKITESKKTEERLYRLINIVDHIGEGVATADLNGTVTYVNQAWADMHGYAVQSLIGKNISIFHSDEQNADDVIPINKKVLRRGYYRGEVGHKRSDGALFSTHMSSTLQKDNDGRVIGFIGVATDLSEQKKVEEALRENEIKFRYLFNLSPQPISLTDLNGNVLDVNQKFCEKMQYSRNEIIGKNTLDLGFPAEERQRFTDLLIENGDVTGYEISHRIKNNDLIQVQLYSKLVQLKGEFYTLTVFHDITAQRKLEAQLVQSQKMEAIGTLAGGIAHDFNNILSAILGYIELAKIYIEPDSKVFQYLEEVFKAGNRARDLVRQILSISRQAEQKRKPVNINLMTKEALRMLKVTLPSTILIKENLGEDIGLIEADPVQIHQVVMNLVTNASQSMKDRGGTLTVKLDTEELQTNIMKKTHGIKAGKYVKLTISDTGHGISIEDRKRIFDPYYTTKAQGMGTGLGLAVAQSIVKKHGGNILFSSKPGTGTDFFIYLPVIDKKEYKDTESILENKSLLPTGTEHILLIDDEDTIIDTGREMLEYLGYSVETFNNSAYALNEFKKNPEKYDLVISDMTMPEMNGDELAKKMIKIRPDIPIIICTGYNPQIDEKTAKAIGLKAFIFKPLTFQKLATTVRDVLDGKGTSKN
jgi:PAS domain S-box-containing protein